MADEERILFETKPYPYRTSMKRILIIWVIIIPIMVALFGVPLDALVNIVIIIIPLDFCTFYLPAISRKYVLTSRSLTRKSWFGDKKTFFNDVGSVTAAKGRILVVNRKGKVIFKIYELYFHPSVREEFKDLLFRYAS